VPQTLIEAYKKARKAITTDILHDTTQEASFLLQIVMGDEACVSHFEPEAKQQSMEWHYMASARKKKFKSVPLA
jgi:hypothetical protein